MTDIPVRWIHVPMGDFDGEVLVLVDDDDPVRVCVVFNHGEMFHHEPIPDVSVMQDAIENTICKWVDIGHFCVQNNLADGRPRVCAALEESVEQPTHRVTVDGALIGLRNDGTSTTLVALHEEKCDGPPDDGPAYSHDERVHDSRRAFWRVSGGKWMPGGRDVPVTVTVLK